MILRLIPEACKIRDREWDWYHLLEKNDFRTETTEWHETMLRPRVLSRGLVRLGRCRESRRPLVHSTHPHSTHHTKHRVFTLLSFRFSPFFRFSFACPCWRRVFPVDRGLLSVVIIFIHLFLTMSCFHFKVTVHAWFIIDNVNYNYVINIAQYCPPSMLNFLALPFG